MRSIINISLPPELSAIVIKSVENGGYSSKSEFFRHLLRLWIVGEELEQSRNELEKGEGKLLKSLRSLH